MSLLGVPKPVLHIIFTKIVTSGNVNRNSYLDWYHTILVCKRLKDIGYADTVRLKAIKIISEEVRKITIVERSNGPSYLRNASYFERDAPIIDVVHRVCQNYQHIWLVGREKREKRTGRLVYMMNLDSKPSDAMKDNWIRVPLVCTKILCGRKRRMIEYSTDFQVVVWGERPYLFPPVGFKHGGKLYKKREET